MQACLETEGGTKTCGNCIESYFKRYMRNYGYVIDYLTKKGLLPIRNYNPRDWFKYSFLMPTYDPQVMRQLSEWVDDLIDRGVPPDKIILKGKWVFDIRKWNGNRWVKVFHKDPVLHAGMPYWVGFDRITKASVPGCCAGNPPSKCGIYTLCGSCGVNNGVAAIALDTGVNPPSGFQVIIGQNCCYSVGAYNANSPAFSYSVSTNPSMTQDIVSWSGTGTLSNSISASYIDFLLDGENYNGTGPFNCDNESSCCTYNAHAPPNTCSCATSTLPYTNMPVELIYEYIGSTNINSGTTISLTIQLIIQLSSTF